MIMIVPNLQNPVIFIELHSYLLQENPTFTNGEIIIPNLCWFKGLKNT